MLVVDRETYLYLNLLEVFFLVFRVKLDLTFSIHDFRRLSHRTCTAISISIYYDFNRLRITSVTIKKCYEKETTNQGLEPTNSELERRSRSLRYAPGALSMQANPSHRGWRFTSYLLSNGRHASKSQTTEVVH